MTSDGSAPFDVFEPVPSEVLNEASILLRVRDSSALDYETVTSYTFLVSERCLPVQCYRCVSVLTSNISQFYIT